MKYKTITKKSYDHLLLTKIFLGSKFIMLIFKILKIKVYQTKTLSPSNK